MINKNLTLIFLTLTLIGCSSGTMDKLVTLKGIAGEQDAMQQMVKEQDILFESMLSEVTKNTWSQFTHQDIIVESYGNPIIKKPLMVDGHAFEIWLYRYSTRYFDSPKIYLTFDELGGLVDFESVEAQQKE